MDRGVSHQFLARRRRHCTIVAEEEASLDGGHGQRGQQHVELRRRVVHHAIDAAEAVVHDRALVGRVWLVVEARIEETIAREVAVREVVARVEETASATAAARVAARAVGAMVVEARAPATFALSFPNR